MSFGDLPPPSAGFSQLDAAARQHEHESQERWQERSATFAVSAVAMPPGSGRRRSHGRGELLISPGSIVFTPFASTSKLALAESFSHTDRSVTVTTARLRAPWANTFVLLHSNGSYLRVSAPAFASRKLRRALLESGFEVQAQAWRAPRLGAG